eukprot:TRINITY_DN26473_c0_g1_i1.p2 TRINITY_DN26473_c0_g1~~TRINITY_DN26473_c0_g1_i1.p2  ORF type:complete len:114 (+),score=25.86 TRINITY_DN26473_c0_g1_i1:155-496(+)
MLESSYTRENFILNEESRNSFLAISSISIERPRPSKSFNSVIQLGAKYISTGRKKSLWVGRNRCLTAMIRKLVEEVFILNIIFTLVRGREAVFLLHFNDIKELQPTTQPVPFQ